MQIEILGNPIAKQRARSFMRHGKMATYDPQHKEKEETKEIMLAQLKDALNSANKSRMMEASNLARGELFSVTLYFGMPIPRSFNQFKVKAILWGLAKPNTKPDIDNLVKFYLDCANGILFPDDRMIVHLTASKSYSRNPMTIMEVIPMQKETIHPDFKKILQIYGPDEVASLLNYLEALQELFLRTDLDYQGEYKESVKAEQMAGHLASLAANHADLLKKITKLYTKEKTPMEGKTLC